MSDYQAQICVMANKKASADQFFQVITAENTDSADILLYGYIGQYDWWSDEDDNETITDLAVAKAIRQLDAKYNVINIRINSPGGSMYHGNAIITAMQTAKATIHTYNDGMAASMGANIWLAGEVRHAAKQSLLMIHAPSSYAFGNAREMRKSADVLDKWEQTAIAIMAEATGMDEEEIKANYYDGDDHWLTAAECQELGWISEVEEYDAQDVVENAAEMNMRDLIAHFSKKGDEQATGWLNQLQQKISSTFSRRVSQSISNKKNHHDMTIEDLKKSLADGTLSQEEVRQMLEEKPAVNTPPAAPSASAKDYNKEEHDQQIATTMETMIANATKPLLEKIAKLEGKPAAPPTSAQSAGDPQSGDGDGAYGELDAFNAGMVKAAKDNDRVNIRK